jgi:PmbA protein
MSKENQDFLDKAKPVAQQLIDYAMTQGKAFGITDAQVTIVGGETQKSAVEKGEISEAVAGMTWKAQVTLYSGKRVLSFTKNTLDAQKLCDAIQSNMQVIHLVPENKDNGLLEKEKVARQGEAGLDLCDETDVGSDALADYGRRFEAAALAVPGVKMVDRLTVKKSKNQSYILATNGLERATARTQYSAMGQAIAEDESGMRGEYEFSAARHFNDMADPEALGREMGLRAVEMLGAQLPETGAMPVVLDPDAAEEFFSIAFEAMDGAAVHNGSTFFKDKIGQQVLSKGVTIVDDPSVRRGLGSGDIDSAGLKMEKMTFVEDGVLKSYGVSLREARQLGVAPIGRQDGLTNVQILPGAQTPAELIGDIEKGIYIRSFNGGTVDVNNGTHSREAYGLLIENGKITQKPVSGFVVSGSLKEMFMNVALANDTPAQPHTRGAVAAPTTRINGCTIAGQ